MRRACGQNPADQGDFRVFNQFTEQFSVTEFADMVRGRRAQLGYEVQIESVPNPRVELEDHYYNARNTKLHDLGLQPHLLGQELVQSMLAIIGRHRGRVIERAIAPRTTWKPGRFDRAPAASATS